MTAQGKHLLMLNFATLVLGTSGPWGRMVTAEITAPYSIFIRCLFSVVFLTGYAWVAKDSLKINLKHWPVLAVSGILLAGHWTFYFEALHQSSVAIGMLSLFTFPVITALLEPLIAKTKLRWTTLLAACLIMVGIFFLTPDLDLSNNITIGILFGLASAVCYALRNFMSKKYVEVYNGTAIMFFQVVITVFILAIFLPYGDMNISAKSLTFLVLLGTVTTGIGHTLFVKSLKHFKTSTASIITSMQPIYGILLALIFFGESINWRIALGGAIIIFSVILESFQSNSSETLDSKK